MKVKIGDLKLEDGTTIRELVDVCKRCKHYGDGCDGDITYIEVEIPQTVKRGRWEYEEYAADFGCWRCSECKTRNYNLPHGVKNPYRFPGSSYCPQCGAKMGETEEA